MIPRGTLAGLKEQVSTYPPRLKETLLRTYIWQATFALVTSEKAADRGDVFRVVGGLFQCVACLVQYLFALNERWCINEKGAIQAIESFPWRPERFGEIVSAVLAHPSGTPDELWGSIGQLEELVLEARLLGIDLPK